MDDEPEVASILSDLLSAAGHHVETAENGAIALSWLADRDVDAILSDIRMPDLDGPGLYRALERQKPDHLRRFNFITGQAQGAPVCINLRTYPVKVEAGAVFLQLD